MYYIRSIEDGRFYSGYSCGSIIWKDHHTRAMYSQDIAYLQGVIDTLGNILEVCTYEFEIIEVDL